MLVGKNNALKPLTTEDVQLITNWYSDPEYYGNYYNIYLMPLLRKRVQATVVEGNEMSCGVLERAGMQKDCIYCKVLFLHGRYVGMYLYATVRDDWRDEES